jgi:hypothetical protein
MRLVRLRDRLPPVSRDASEQLEALYHNLGFGAGASICMPAARSTSEGLQVSKENAFGFTLRQGTTSSLYILCAWGASRPRPSRGRISATRAIVIRMRKSDGV